MVYWKPTHLAEDQIPSKETHTAGLGDDNYVSNCMREEGDWLIKSLASHKKQKTRPGPCEAQGICKVRTEGETPVLLSLYVRMARMVRPGWHCMVGWPGWSDQDGIVW